MVLSSPLVQWIDAYLYLWEVVGVGLNKATINVMIQDYTKQVVFLNLVGVESQDHTLLEYLEAGNG